MERRRIERKYLVFYLRVFEGVSHSVLGYLLDISPEGLMLVADSPVSLELDFQLRMHLPTQSRDREEVTFAATSRWCKKDANPNFFLAGFQIDQLEFETERLIHGLVADFGFERRPEPPFGR